MEKLKNLLSVIVALISAIALLLGYRYQKQLERDADIRETQQKIYSRLISNITERNAILGRLLDQAPEYAKAKPEEKHQVEQMLMDSGRLTSPELSKNEGDRTEVIAELCLYGTDEAIHAYAAYAKANAERTGGDLGRLVLGLRHSIDAKTQVSAGEADLAIWNEPKYLQNAPPAK
jgi:hypothetical protein